MARLLFLCGIAALLGMTAPAMAGCARGDHCWARGHHAIYRMENRVALLQADPTVDDAYKGPLIVTLQRRILQVRSAIGMRWAAWPTPCCYSRRPIYLH